MYDNVDDDVSVDDTVDEDGEVDDDDCDDGDDDDDGDDGDDDDDEGVSSCSTHDMFCFLSSRTKSCFFGISSIFLCAPNRALFCLCSFTVSCLFLRFFVHSTFERLHGHAMSGLRRRIQHDLPNS